MSLLGYQHALSARQSGSLLLMADICNLPLLQRHSVEIQVNMAYRRTLF